MLLKLKKSLLVGLFFSCIVTVIWLLLSSSLKGFALSMLQVAFSGFLFYLFVSVLVRKCSRKVQILSKVLLETLIILIFLSVSISLLANLMMFHPHFDEESYHQLAAEVNSEELNATANGENISGWRIPHADETAPVILYFGGNGENSSTKVLWLLNESKERTPFFKYNFIYFDYPGYGKSSGSPSEASFKHFGLSVYDWVKENYPDSEIILLGYSIGTGVANYVASERNVDGLILLAPYADGYDLYNNQVGIFHGPLQLLVTYKMEAINFAKNISVSPLILASDQDEIVPYESSLRLSKAYPYGSEFITINGIAHNDLKSNQDVLNYIDNYIEEVLIE